MATPGVPTADQADDGSAPTTGRARRRLAGALIGPPVVALALFAIGLAGGGAYHAAREGLRAARHPANTTSARQTLAVIDTVRAQFAAEVPAGSRIYLDPALSRYADPVWSLYLLEFAAMNGVLAVPEVGQADHVVSVVRAPRGAGLRLTVRRVR